MEKKEEEVCELDILEMELLFWYLMKSRRFTGFEILWFF
jgi:hypothetical protein